MPSRMLLLGAGLALVVASTILSVASRPDRSSPGELRASTPVIDWQCPAPSEGAPSTAAPPSFEVVNVGGSPVRILSVATSCGCARAEANPLLVPPGGRSTIVVEMDPIEVGVRAATVTLETDSPSRPTVGLQIAAEGYHKPPYLLRSTEGLFFREGYSREEPREFVVDAVAAAREPETPPVVACDLPFLQFDPPTVRDGAHLKGPDFVTRTYRYPVRFVAEPPDEGFSGRITVADPWVEGRSLACNVLGEPNHPIRVVPSRVVLKAGQDGGARFLARSNRGDGSVTAAVEEPDSPLLVQEAEEMGDSGFHAFRVRWKAGRASADRADRYHVIIRAGANDEASVTLPVQIRDERR